MVTMYFMPPIQHWIQRSIVVNSAYCRISKPDNFVNCFTLGRQRNLQFIVSKSDYCLAVKRLNMWQLLMVNTSTSIIPQTTDTTYYVM